LNDNWFSDLADARENPKQPTHDAQQMIGS
jgi:hypothetical protein